MVLRADRTTVRVLETCRFAMLCIVAVLIAHDAIFLAQKSLTGPAAHLRAVEIHAGHWPFMSALATIAGILLLAWAVAHLAGLTHGGNRLYGRFRVGHARRRRSARPAVAAYRTELVKFWCTLHPAVVLAFASIENIEHLAAGEELLGFGAVTGPHFPLALPVLGAVTLALAAIGALVRWRIAVLRAQVGYGPKRDPRRTVRIERPVALWFEVAALCSRVCIQARQDSGRPPPLLATA